MTDWTPPIPKCPHCEKPMQLNTAVSTLNVKQFIHACQATPVHINVHRGQKGRDE